MTAPAPTTTPTPQPARAVRSAPPRPVCLACARARREGRPWGCVVHVAEGVL